MGRLTVNSVKAKRAAGRYGDGDGLYLLVKPSGTRSWVLRVQDGGRRRDIGLGAVQTDSLIDNHGLSDVSVLHRKILTLAEAREKASILRQYAKAGRDPILERDKERRSAPTFKEAATTCHEALSKGWAPKHAAAFLASLEEHAFPVIGLYRVDQIDAGRVIEALSPIWTDKPVMARKVRQRIGTVLAFAKSKGWRKDSAPDPQELRRGLAKQPKRGNFAAMPYADVPSFYVAVSGKPGTTGRSALLFLILTGARSGEVRHARWSHIDFDAKLWRRPASLMKTGEGHDVTLNGAALALLKRLDEDRQLKVDGLIFAGRRGKPLSDMTLAKVLRDAKLPYVPHGFRSSFRDWAAEKMHRIPDPVAEAALAHKVPDDVIAAYKRTKFLDLRRELLDAWGRFVASTGA